jgi:hypothetical protein
MKKILACSILALMFTAGCMWRPSMETSLRYVDREKDDGTIAKHKKLVGHVSVNSEFYVSDTWDDFAADFVSFFDSMFKGKAVNSTD